MPYSTLLRWATFVCPILLPLVATAVVTDALDTYKYVIDNYPESKEAELSPDRVMFCQSMMETDWEDVRSYFLSVADTSEDVELKFASRASAAW